MPRVGWLLLAFVTATGAALPRPPLPAAIRAAADALPVEDPFPIRRVRGTDARLPDLLKELEPGPTVRLPRAEFESRVRAAGRAALSAKHAARVVDADYTAELDGGDLTGTAKLGILNAHDVTGFVPLDPLKLAVREAKWADDRPALLASPGGAAAVWVDRAGRSVLRLNWSLAGTTEPGERRFELRVPPCPVATLALNLPADQVPTAAADVLLTGPFEVSGKPTRQLWRLRFGGKTKAEFALRAANQPGGVVQAKLVARYDVQPGQVSATFEYDLRPARGSAAEWTFTADPGLRVTDVVTNNRAGWSVDPPATPGGPRTVRVTLRAPAPGGKVVITAVAAPADAPLPAVRPLDAVLDDERVEVKLAPGLKVDAWTAGDYRLTETTAGADPSRALTLVGTLVSAGATDAFRRMPTVRVAAAEAEFTTFERLEWELDSTRSTLAARVTVRVRRGPLFAIAVRPPPGFALDRGASAADERVAHIGPLVGGQHAVEFARPLSAGQTADVRLEFRAAVRPDEPRAFPAFAVAGAAERDGWLSAAAAPGWTLTTRPGAGASPGGLWAWLTTDAPADAQKVYPFRGKEPDGTATLLPVRPLLTADATVRIDAANGVWVATTRFALSATGPVQTLTAFVPGPPGPRTWKLLDESNALTDATAVPHELTELAPLFSPFDPRAALVAAHARDAAGGARWVLRFARPLANGAVLETTAPGPPTSDTAASLLVPKLVGARQTTRAEIAASLSERTVAELNGDFVRPRPRPSGEANVGVVTDAYLVTAVRGPGEAIAAFGGTARAVVRLTLPPGAEVRGVCVGGKWLNPAACADRDSAGALRVPIPPNTATRFEVRYRLPPATGWPTRRIDSPTPAAPGDPAVKRWWAFAVGSLPGWPARPWEETEAQPPLLGGPLSGGEPFAVVTRSDDEWIRVGESRTADALAGALAAGLVLLGLVAARRRRARGAVVLASALVLALLVVELGPPWWVRAAWPPLCAATLGLAAVLVSVALHSRAPLSALAAVLLFLIPALAATGQPLAPATVLILPTEDGEVVIAARATLDRLDALAKPPPPGPVVTAATYEVRADGAGARVTAKLVAHAFRPSDNVLSLQLADVRLERATVDGAAAFPTATAPGVYAVALGGAGRYEVELRFAAAVVANGSERELKFGAPEVPEAKLTATFPAAARGPVAVGRVGRQSVATGADRTTLEADLGAAKVHLRWREGGGGAAAVKVREACVWDVSEAGADLTAAYLVRVEGGAVAGMRFEVPAELEVLRVAARSLEPAGPLPLRDWRLDPEKAAPRLLRVDFQAPASGRLLVVLECAPRKPLSRQPVLRFPRVVFGAAGGESDAVYGLRSARVQIDGVGLGGVIDFPNDPLKDFAAVPDLRLEPLAAVRAFKPAAGAAELRPALRVGDPVAVRTATAWHVGGGRADASGTVSWQSKEPLPLLEFALPSVKVTEVRGPDVAAWGQSGGRVQVWLRGGPRKGAVEWSATAVLPADGLFEPVHPQVTSSRHAEVRVKPVAGWALAVERVRGWQGGPTAAGELRFHTDLPAAQTLRVQLSVK